MSKISGSLRPTMSSPPSSTPTSGKEKRMEERRLGRPPQLTQIPRPQVALFSEISSQIQQPRHSWHHPQQASKRPFCFFRRPRKLAHKFSVVCLGERQDHNDGGLLWTRR